MIKKIPEKEYRAIPMISQSDCKAILGMSGFEFQHYKLSGIPETQAMLRGTMAHGMALEGASYVGKEYAIDRWPSLTGKSRTQKGLVNGKEMSYQNYKTELLASGKKHIKEEDIAQAEGIARAVHRDFGKLLREGQPELPMWDIDLGGRKCKGMADFLPPAKYIFDLKTTSKLLTDSQCYKFLQYDLWKIQAAFYHDLYLKETGESRLFVFLVVNDKPPYATRKIVVQPESDMMESGRDLYLQAISTYNEYEQIDGDWPHRPLYDVQKMEQNRV